MILATQARTAAPAATEEGMRTLESIVGAAVTLALLGAAAPVRDDAPIRIGELNSYKAQPAFLEPYRKGWQLAVEQINAAGGVLGRPLQIVVRDDNANPGDAVRAAQELVSQEKVDVIMGGFYSHVGLAVADFARQNKIVYLASEPLTDKLVWQNGNRYTFRLRPSTYMQVAMLVPGAAAMQRKRWAIVYPNYEYGQSAASTFKSLLKARQPDVEFVAEQATPLGKVDAGAVVQAIDDARPDAIFNVLFGADLAKFVREGQTRGVFAGRQVVGLLTGEPEYLDPLKDDAPTGWLVTGYPWSDIDTPLHRRFLQAYRRRYDDYPRLGSVVGYASVQALAAAIRKAGSTDPDRLAAAFAGLQVQIPFGDIVFRSQDHQSTMGCFVGRLGVVDGKGVMASHEYLDGAAYQPSDQDVRALRPAD
jgi:branched-chain amino acid transport system substrate-binding protein